ncbi:hypothetical protein GGR54DRAFT_403742 [Hypoxylon sp. NC1633]|nr:hypothetical protein GGR54DRAFT_403742 [Hypoxylon sp. NC1633]
MTEKSPEVLAVADLTPVSPVPLHVSSPIVVPTLQSQADEMSSMSLSASNQEPAPSSAAMAEVEGAATQNGVQATDFDNLGDHNVDSATLYGNGDGARGQGEGTNPVKDEKGDAQHSDYQNGVAEAQQHVAKTAKTTKSSHSSDTSESLTVVSSHDNSPHHDQTEHHFLPIPGLPSAHPQVLHEPRETSEPQRQVEEVVAPSADSIDASQLLSAAPARDGEVASRSTAANGDGDIDIQSIVDRIVGVASAGDPYSTPAPQDAANLSLSSQSDSLPPRPPTTQHSSQLYVHPEDARHNQLEPHHIHAIAASPSLPPSVGIYSAGAHGTASDSRNSVPLPSASSPTSQATSFPMAQFDIVHSAPATAATQPQTIGQPQQWETFIEEERRYLSDAKWDQFPEGSRLFIGNLSSDRVSKKEVFDIFSSYGRLAQISLKQAYGFVQYHSFDEGRAAIDHLQGKDVQGRKIHLEFSRMQKKDGERERRGNKGRRNTDRHDGGRGRRDDYRPGRQQSPRRGNYRRQLSVDSGRGHYDDYPTRGRSRSPGHGRRDSGNYRNRSPDHYRLHPPDLRPHIPHPQWGDVPDVDFLLVHEIQQDFVDWVKRAFANQGLKVHLRLPHPLLPQEGILQQQVVEGVIAVSELDYRAQQTGLISLRIFDRSAGRDNVRYDQYLDLDPTIAAQLVARAKAYIQPQPYYGAQHEPIQYPQPSQVPYPPPSYHAQSYASSGAPGRINHAGVSVGNSTLHTVLGNLHNQHIPPNRAYPANINALSSHLGGTYEAGAAGTHPQHNVGYQALPANGNLKASGGSSTDHVQNIMTQLARYRQ